MGYTANKIIQGKENISIKKKYFVLDRNNGNVFRLSSAAIRSLVDDIPELKKKWKKEAHKGEFKTRLYYLQLINETYVLEE